MPPTPGMGTQVPKTDKDKITHIDLSDKPKPKGTMSTTPSPSTGAVDTIRDYEKKIADAWNKRWASIEKMFKSTFWSSGSKDHSQGLWKDMIGLEDWKTMDWEPRSELIESKDMIRVKVEVPGVNKNDIKIELKTTPDGQREILHIRGVKHSDTTNKMDKAYIHETLYGGIRDFDSTLEFDREWVFSNARIVGTPRAKLEAGVLTLDLPKKDIEEVKPRIQSVQISD